MSDAPKPEAMRQAMRDYVTSVHQAYLNQANLQSPAIRGRMLLLNEPFTVVAAGVSNLHVIATSETLAMPQGPEVAIEDELAPMRWTLRFYDPVVLPPLGMIDERSGPAGGQVRRALGISTYLYHLIVQPGAELTGHQAGHAGAGLANSHIAAARDFEAIRAHAGNRAHLVDEMEGASLAGLHRAQALLAAEIAPWADGLADVDDPIEIRRRLLEELRNRG